MSPFLRRTGAMFFLAAAAATLAPACVANENSIYIRSFLITPADTCVVEADPMAASKSGGVFDVSVEASLSGGYVGALLIANQLVRRGDPDLLRTETSKVEIYGADISVRDRSEATLARSNGEAAEFFTWASGFADASTGAAAGLGVVFLNMIDAELANDLRNELLSSGRPSKDVVVYVVIRGRTLGGIEVASGEWWFPVRVCLGCLCGCDASAMPTTPCNAGSDNLACGSFDAGTSTCR